ncbi:protein of unknown function [Vibrio tapetis subsp. tapetis]|uniref:Uncharacterized protein n=1 Tax=Vibrio tapetis subsp. tapetis TaxID=1671868 RepID=A0A2N8ZKT1_9VIBR|nr:protein of unknown function [Vibrio tapetis subsp. tapetis]
MDEEAKGISNAPTTNACQNSVAREKPNEAATMPDSDIKNNFLLDTPLSIMPVNFWLMKIVINETVAVYKPRKIGSVFKAVTKNKLIIGIKNAKANAVKPLIIKYTPDCPVINAISFFNIKHTPFQTLIRPNHS